MNPLRPERRVFSGFRLRAWPAATLGALLSLALLHGACAPARLGSSTVGTGRRYLAQDPNHDRLFAELHALQVELKHAPEREQRARALLANRLGSGDTGELVVRVAERIRALDAVGTSVTHDASAGLVVSGKPPSPEAQGFITALGETLRLERELAERMNHISARLPRLAAAANGLDRTLTAQTKPNTSAETKELLANVRDAQRLLPLMEQRAVQVRARALELADGLARALPAQSDSGSVREAPTPVEHERTPQRPSNQRRRVPDPPPRAAPPAPTDEPAGGADFEP